jgi:hypothetical protein
MRGAGLVALSWTLVSLALVWSSGCKTNGSSGQTGIDDHDKGTNAAALCPRATREDCNKMCSTGSHPQECYQICKTRCPPCRDASSEWCDRQ